MKFKRPIFSLGYVVLGVWLASLALHTAVASSIVQQAYNLVQNAGSPLTRRTTINCTGGLTCSDSGGVTVFNAAGTGNAGPGITVYSGISPALTGTLFFPIGGGTLASATETDVQAKAPFAATISNFYVVLSAPLGMGNTGVFTWRDGASSQALTCTITGAVAVTCADTTHTFNASAADLLDIQLVITGTVVVTPIINMSVQFGAGTGTAFYQTVQDEGSSLTQRAILNFTGAGVTCADSGGKTACDVPSGAPSANQNIRSVGAGFDGGGTALSAGKTVYVTVPFACTIAAWNITVDTGTATVDVWKITTGTAIPTIANTITAAALPAISTGTAIHSTTLSGWTTSVAANDIFGFNINAVSGVTELNIVLQCNATT